MSLRLFKPENRLTTVHVSARTLTPQPPLPEVEGEQELVFLSSSTYGAKCRDKVAGGAGWGEGLHEEGEQLPNSGFSVFQEQRRVLIPFQSGQ